MKIVDVTVRLKVEDDVDPADWEWCDLLDMTSDEFLGVVKDKIVKRNVSPKATEDNS
jgi:hypothetical protein